MKTSGAAPRAWLVAQLVLLLSAPCELDAWNGAFVLPATRLLQNGHQPGGKAHQAMSGFRTCGLLPKLSRQGAAGSVMQTNAPEEKRRATGLGHEYRGTMSDELIVAKRANDRAAASQQRVEETMGQRRAEFMAQRFREAEKASEQRRKNKAAELLEESLQQQPIGKVASSVSAPKTMAAPTRGRAFLEEAFAEDAEQIQQRAVAVSSAAKTGVKKKAPSKKAAKPKAAPVIFHDITVESVPSSAALAGITGNAEGATAGKAMVNKVTMIDPRDAWTSDKPMPRLKRPEELVELVHIINLALRDVPGYTEASYTPEEIAVQKVRLTGRRWYMWLEEEDLIDFGKDPARFPVSIRQRYLEEIAYEGIELVSDEEALKQMSNHIETREQRDISRSIKYVEKVAGDYALLFGAPALEETLHSVKFTKEQEIAAKRDPWVLKAVSTITILRAYSETSRQARDLLGEGHVLSADWDRKQFTFHQFENKRATSLAQFRAHLRAKSNGEEQLVQEVNLNEGDFVDVEIKSKGPLGYVVKIDHMYDGLVYHNDIFENPPSVGDLTDGWVLKVREDGKVDVTLRPPGAVAKISDGVERVLQALKKHKNRLELGDKSSPKEVYNILGLSKKVFKEALGHMYKRKMVILGRTEVRLQPMERWETGIVGSKDEVRAVKADAQELAASGSAQALGGSKTLGNKTRAKPK